VEVHRSALCRWVIGITERVKPTHDVVVLLASLFSPDVNVVDALANQPAGGIEAEPK
jgi:hypothetical protein